MDRTHIESLIARHGAAAVYAAARPLLSDERAARIDAVLGARLGSLTVVLEDLYDPHNGAAAIRSVEAFGLTGVHAVEAAGKLPVSAAVTIGAEKWVDLHRHPDVDACAAALRTAGYRLCATCPDSGDDAESLDVATPWAIWFGNERDGLSSEAVAACDATIAIPMQGFTRSFNLSVSVALVISRLAARRRQHLGTGGDLDAETTARLRARFAATGIRGLDELVARHVSD